MSQEGSGYWVVLKVMAGIESEMDVANNRANSGFYQKSKRWGIWEVLWE